MATHLIENSRIPANQFPDLGPFVARLLARSNLTDIEQHAILDLPSEAFHVPARHDFVRLDQETDHCCFIVSGLVARVGQLRNGLRQITALHIPGDMADLHSAVRPIGLGGLTALSDTVIARIPHDAVRTLAQQYPAVAEAFWRDCMLDAAILMQWVVNIGRKVAAGRLAHILCEMAIRYAGAGRDPLLEFSLPTTQEQLGDATAMTAVHVNRSLRVLRQKGTATFRSGVVQIHDWKELALAGEFDPAYLLADTMQDRQQRLIWK
jgi:CRP-like cAMP-binding protein